MAELGTVAVLGAGGTMGRPMARNLALAGYHVRAWNRSISKAEPLTRDGAVIASTPGQAAAGADVVLTMLADTDAVLSAMNGPDGALTSMTHSSTWLQMSTIGETGTTQCAELAARYSVRFVDAPVLGTREPAEQGTLVVLASGPDSVRELVEQVFAVLGQKTMWVGKAGTASKLKLVLNAWVVSVVEAGAEIVALAEGLGLAPALVFEALDGGPLDLPYLRIKGKAMIDRDFDPSFRLALAAKDAALVDESARGLGLDLPVLAAVSERMAQGAKQHPDEDMSAVYLISSRR